MAFDKAMHTFLLVMYLVDLAQHCYMVVPGLPFPDDE